MNDETLKEQIQKILTLPHIKKFYDFCIEEDIDEEVMYKIAGWLGSEIYFMPASAEILLMQLIKQDRERAVREARIDELTKLINRKWLYGNWVSYFNERIEKLRGEL